MTQSLQRSRLMLPGHGPQLSAAAPVLSSSSQGQKTVPALNDIGQMSQIMGDSAVKFLVK
jgi:hypothetical protein